MKTVLKVVGALIALVLLAAGVAYGWAKSAASARLDKSYVTHQVDFPIPFPLNEAELNELRAEKAKALPADAPGADPLAGVDVSAVALERAQARGKHLVESLYPCIECHGKDFSGGTMIDDPPIGRILGVNLTSGKGGVTAKYTAADWDRVVRHGVLPTGKPTVMPSGDFAAMSDQELSDIVAYIRSLPPVDNDVPRPTYGPVGTLLMAGGKVRVSAEELSHEKPHAGQPPAPAVTAEFGAHVLQVCTGCHGVDLTGGPIPGGPPDWAEAANITPHADGLAGWTYEEFLGALLKAQSKDGRALRQPMANMPAYASKYTDTELRALWAAVQALPPKPSNKPRVATK